MSADSEFALSRRAFATGLTGSLAALGMADAAAAAGLRDAAGPADLRDADLRDADLRDADLRDAALRGLARAGDLGDPVLAARADAVLAELAGSDPEGALLVRVYRAYDGASAASRYGSPGDDRASATDLAALHAAVRDCRAVSFRYTDLEGEVTVRTVLPLALVHPPQGIKLLAWCEKRQDIRQFFVRALGGLTPEAAEFRDRRLALLRRLAESAAARA